MILDVFHCARCGEDHPVEFYQFTNAPQECDGVLWPYWGICPINGEPILMKMMQEEETEESIE